MVLDVPQEIGQQDQKGNSTACEKPPCEKNFSLRCQKNSRQEGKRKHRHRVFVFHTQPSQYSKRDPKLRILCLNHSNEHKCASEPEQGFERVHCELVIDYEPDGYKGGNDRSKCDSEVLRSQRASQSCAEKNSSCTRQRRPENQRRKRSAQRIPRYPADQNDQRGMVDVPQIEMLATSQIVQCVAEVTIPGGGHQVEQEISECDHQRPREQAG